MEIIICLIFVGAVVFFLVKNSRKYKANNQNREILMNEAKAFVEKLIKHEPIERPRTPVILKSAEMPWLFDSCLLKESRSTRVSSGVGVRVMKGLYVGGSESSSYQSLKDIEHGTLTLTNQRLVFVGRLESRKIFLKDISSVNLYPNAIGIINDRTNIISYFVVGNPYLWHGCITLFSESLDEDEFGEGYGRISDEDSKIIDVTIEDDEDESLFIDGKKLGVSDLEKFRSKLAENVAEMDILKEGILRGEIPVIPSLKDFLVEGEDGCFVENTNFYEVFYPNSGTLKDKEKEKSVRIEAGEYFNNSEIKLLGEGVVILSTKRIIFEIEGSKKSILLGRVSYSRMFLDSTEIFVRDEAKHYIFHVKNPYKWISFIGLLKGWKPVSDNVLDSTNLENQDLGPQYPPDSPFKAKARLHQSKYRCSVLKAGYETYGSWLAKADAEKGANFYKGLGIFEEVKKAHDYSKNVYADMLRSEHIPFNFFAPLMKDKDYAKETLNHFVGNIIDKVNEIRIEYAPGPPEKHLNDKTAFDVFIDYLNTDGKRGLIGIEMKYTEGDTPLKEGSKEEKEVNNPSSRYWKVTSKSAIYIDGPLDLLKSDDLRQIWRNQILGESVLLADSGVYKHSTLILIYPEGNSQFTKVGFKYSKLLKQPSDKKFVDITYEKFFNALGKKSKDAKYEKWVEYLKDRYLVD